MISTRRKDRLGLFSDIDRSENPGDDMFKERERSPTAAGPLSKCSFISFLIYNYKQTFGPTV